MCTESLACSPETVETLLIGYVPIKNVFGVKQIFETERLSMIKSTSRLPNSKDI